MDMTMTSKKLTNGKVLIALIAIAMLIGLGAGCSDASFGGIANEDAAGVNNAAAPNEPGAGVGQSGAQDFGRFRSIVEDGEIPAPNTLDAVGFFNEHKFELPAADCGNNVCMHGMFGVWGNMLNGANCTLSMLGFNTPLNPADFDRPPLNMAIAVDVSGSMAGAPIREVRAGLLKLADNLQVKDEVTLVTYSTNAEVVLVSNPDTDPDRALFKEAVANLEARGGTNIYEGLREALREVDSGRDQNRQNRVILLSDGVATEGIENRERIINLGESYANEGIGITTIGVGDDFDIELMQRLSESGSGNFYYIEDLATVEEVFTEEVNTFLIPVAEDVRIDFDVAKGYRFRAAYGTRTWEGESDSAAIFIPSLFIASRTSVDDVGPGNGRRGGGGAILFEVVPTTDDGERRSVAPGEPIGQFSMTYRMPGTDQEVTQTTTVINKLAPGDTPDTGEFDDVMVEKAFVALNIYVGFKLASERFAAGAPRQALGILVPLEQAVEQWLVGKDDVDIEDDLATLRQLITNLQQVEPTQPEQLPPAPNPWPEGD